MLEAAVEVTSSPEQRALLLATLANELTYAGNYPRRRALADEALRIARATGDQTLTVRVMNQIFFSVWVPETLAERLAMSEESRLIVAHVDDPLVRFWASISNYLNFVQAGRIADGDQLLEETRGLADRLGQPALQWRATHRMAARFILGGDVERAEEYAQRGLDLGTQAGDAAAIVYFKSQTMCIHWMRGTMASIGERIRRVTPRQPHEIAALALIFAESGRADDAVAILDRATAAAFADLPRDPAFITSLSMYAEAAVLTSHTAAARELHPLLMPFAGQVGFDGVTSVGGLEHYLGALATLLGKYDEAVERLDRSAAFHREVGARFFEARNHLQLGVALQARGSVTDLSAADRAFAEAGRLAERHGYRLVHERAAARLARRDGG